MGKVYGWYHQRPEAAVHRFRAKLDAEIADAETELVKLREAMSAPINMDPKVDD